VEFEGCLYFSDEVGPYIPGENIERCLREGAKFTKMGKAIQRGLTIIDLEVPLLYNGPRDLEKLLDDPNFRLRKPVRVQASRPIRTRPKFSDWELEVEAEIDPKVLDVDQIATIAEHAGSMEGLGDYRPRYGRFTTAVVAA